jgi:hypothetical protein
LIKGLSPRVVLALALLGAVATGCTTGGTPTPGPTGGSTSTEQTSETTSTKPSTGNSSLANFDSCAALNAVAPQLGLTEIEPDGESCDAEFNATTSVTMKARADLGLADVVTTKGEASSTNIGSRKATLLKGSTTDESCLIAVEVTATSRVDIAGSSNNSQADSCNAVTAVATAIEPKLPK